MNSFTRLITLIILTSFISCGPQKQLTSTLDAAYTNIVPALDAHNSTSESVIYALPKTMLRFTLTVQKEHKKRGPLYRYSNLYLDAEDLVTVDETIWTLKSVDVDPIGLLDNTKIYKVNFRGNTGSGNVELAENGCIKSVNVNLLEEIEIEKISHVHQTHVLDTSFSSVPMTEELLRANSTAKMAEEAAAFIYRLRENRVALVSGELEYFPQDGNSLDISLKQVKHIEDEFVSLFIGKTDREEVKVQFDYIPEGAVTKAILFRFSKFKGMVPSDDFSGSPVLITLTPDHLLNLPNNESEPIYDEKGELVEVVKKNGFYYTLPMQTSLSVENNGKQFVNERLNIAQFGKTLSLPADLLDQNDKGIVFHPETGAIKKIINKK